MAVDIEWVRENPEEAARQLDMFKNMISDIQLMTSFVSEGRWPELTMLSSNPELAKLGEALNKLQVKHLTQIVDLVEQREQYRTAEEAQIALRKKAEEKRDVLEAYVQEVRTLAADWFENEQTLAATWQLARKVGKWSLDAPATNFARRDALKQAEAMRHVAKWLSGEIEEECIGLDLGGEISGPTGCSSADKCRRAGERIFKEAARIWEDKHLGEERQ